MINLVVELLEGFDPLFDWFNVYEVFILPPLFLFIFKKTKNFFALFIVLECLVAHSLSYVFGFNILLENTSQFILYGFAFYFTYKNPLITISYLILLFLFLVKWVANSIHLDVMTMKSYNIAALTYYAYYPVLALVLWLMIKGLFSKGGGTRYGYDNINNRIVYNSDNLLGSSN